MPHNIPECIFNNVRRDPNSCGVRRDDVLNDSVYERDKKLYGSNVKLLDMSDILCDDKFCFAVKDKTIIYYDDDHLTATFSKSLAKEIKLGIDSALGRVLH